MSFSVFVSVQTLVFSTVLMRLQAGQGVKNIYFEGYNNTWVCQDCDEISEDSSLSSNESSQTINKKENNVNYVERNISGTDSTEKKNEKVSGTKTVYKNFSPVRNSKNVRTDVSTTHEIGTDFCQIFQYCGEISFFNYYVHIHVHIQVHMNFFGCFPICVSLNKL